MASAAKTKEEAVNALREAKDEQAKIDTQAQSALIDMQAHPGNLSYALRYFRLLNKQSEAAEAVKEATTKIASAETALTAAKEAQEEAKTVLAVSDTVMNQAKELAIKASVADDIAKQAVRRATAVKNLADKAVDKAVAESRKADQALADAKETSHKADAVAASDLKGAKEAQAKADEAKKLYEADKAAYGQAQLDSHHKGPDFGEHQKIDQAYADGKAAEKKEQAEKDQSKGHEPGQGGGQQDNGGKDSDRSQAPVHPKDTDQGNRSDRKTLPQTGDAANTAIAGAGAALLALLGLAGIKKRRA